MCGCNLVMPRLIGGDRHSSSGSFAKLAAMRRASSRVRRCAAKRRGRRSAIPQAGA